MARGWPSGRGLWCKMSDVGENGEESRIVSADELFAVRHFDAEIVVLYVRWYLMFIINFDPVKELDLFESNNSCGMNGLTCEKHSKRT